MGHRLALACALALLVLPGAARAAEDLVALPDDPPVELTGAYSYGEFYVDTELRLLGDTRIDAARIYIGPNAWIRSCMGPGDADDACTAGRSLTLNAAGEVVVAQPVDLRGYGAAAPGGSLRVSGASIVLGDGVRTDGQGAAPSGAVTIAATGPVVVRDVYTRGAAITLRGARIEAGELRSAGTWGDDRSAAPVRVTATGGDVRTGDVAAGGNDGQGTRAGGSGAPVDLSGGNVFTGTIDASGGEGGGGFGAGPSAAVHVTAGGEVQVAGQIWTEGATGTGGGWPAAAVTVSARGDVHLAQVQARGGRGAAGGPIRIAGRNVATGYLVAQGGETGGAGGSVVVTGTAGVNLPDVLVQGSSAYPAAVAGGAGGSAAISGSSVAVGQISAFGEWSDVGAGAAGGTIVVRSLHGLAVVRADVGGGRPGGRGGTVVLDAGDAPLTVPAGVAATGASGADPDTGPGGAGGAGGRIDVLGASVAASSLLASGGDGGWSQDGGPQGAGAAGGRIRAFTAGDPFDGRRFVATDGGAGEPDGEEGTQELNGPPDGLALDGWTLRFESGGPAITGYRVLHQVKGSPPVTVATGAATELSLKRFAPCARGTLQVVATATTPRWTSPASAAVPALIEPAGAGSCKVAPKLEVTRVRAAGKTLKVTLKVKGYGLVTVRVMAGRQRRGILANQAVRPGTVTLAVPVARRRGVRIVADGHAYVGARTSHASAR